MHVSHNFSTFALEKISGMKLVIMTESTFFVEEDKILSALFDEGLEQLHLYKPGNSPIYSERLLSLLSDNYYNKIVVHGNYYLKNEYGLGAIHLDEPDEPVPEGYRGRLGRTCTELDQLKETKKKANFVFLNNFSNYTADGANGLSNLKIAARHGLIDKKVYALGGIDIEHIALAKDLGFGGVVVKEDLWNRFDIHTGIDYKEIINHFKELRKAVG